MGENQGSGKGYDAGVGVPCGVFRVFHGSGFDARILSGCVREELGEDLECGGKEVRGWLVGVGFFGDEVGFLVVGWFREVQDVGFK